MDNNQRSMSTRVDTKIEGHIAQVTLVRPEKMNALDEPAFTQLIESAEQIKADSSVRVVLLKADGEHFCSGADKSFLQGAVSDQNVFKERALNIADGEYANTFQKPVTVWLDLNVPVIACLQGVVFGAGMQLALAADIRIGSPTTSMSLFEIHWGLIPDMGITQTLPRLTRADIATELVLTGRIVSSKEAEQIGLVTRIVEDPLSDAKNLANIIIAKSPDATRRGKQLLRDSAQMNRADALKLEAVLQSELVGTPNQMEAASANLAKRKALFR